MYAGQSASQARVGEVAQLLAREAVRPAGLADAFDGSSHGPPADSRSLGDVPPDENTVEAGRGTDDVLRGRDLR
ncbi:hypothetical protein GCM10010365_58370 [Streptomyces poonensis]|uniref:Uncharacterized protein n=1 Tax=Streptomyces poonensis TaxID=68255 RepID=A0A918Q0V9_9ACTN|nr:hypothetical protein GCM10010365_58370 [Streptomyces poonensis]